MDSNHMMETARESLHNTAREIDRVSSYLDETQFAQVVTAIMQCRTKVLVCGIGTSGAAARKIAHSLACVEIPALYLNPGDAAHGASGMIQAEDVIILLSKGGQSSELLTLIPIIKQRGGLIIAVTEQLQSTLARSADILLQLNIERESDQAGVLATASTLVTIATFDAVCSVLMRLKGFTGERFLSIHPGGAVGKKLMEKQGVADDR